MDDSQRTGESVLREVDYWQMITDDLRSLSDLVLKSARGATKAKLAGAMISIKVAFAPGTVSDVIQPELAEIDEGSGAATEASQEILDRIVAMMELAAGRALAIRDEMGLPPADATPET